MPRVAPRPGAVVRESAWNDPCCADAEARWLRKRKRGKLDKFGLDRVKGPSFNVGSAERRLLKAEWNELGHRRVVLELHVEEGFLQCEGFDLNSCWLRRAPRGC